MAKKSVSYKKSLDYATRCQESYGSIEYIRVKEIEDSKPGQLMYGFVILTDCVGKEVVYHRPSVYAESKGPGEYLSLTGPSRPIVPSRWFHISVNLWVKLCDQGTEITKEIANGEVYWDESEPVGKPLEQVIEGEHGSVTVGFSITPKAYRATIDVVLMNELPAQIYGTIKAVRVLGESSSITKMLFDKSENEWVHLNPQQSLPLTPPVVFPAAVDFDLTIEVDLWNHANPGRIVGSLQFAPIFSDTQMMTISGECGQVQVSITCK